MCGNHSFYNNKKILSPLRMHFCHKSFILNHKKCNHRLEETEKDSDNATDANLTVFDALCLVTITELLTALYPSQFHLYNAKSQHYNNNDELHSVNSSTEHMLHAPAVS